MNCHDKRECDIFIVKHLLLMKEYMIRVGPEEIGFQIEQFETDNQFISQSSIYLLDWT